jgi:hypothetical protein
MEIKKLDQWMWCESCFGKKVCGRMTVPRLGARNFWICGTCLRRSLAHDADFPDAYSHRVLTYSDCEVEYFDGNPFLYRELNK